MNLLQVVEAREHGAHQFEVVVHLPQGNKQLMFRVQGSGFRVQGAGCRGPGSWSAPWNQPARTSSQ